MKVKLICILIVYLSLIFLALSKLPSLITESLLLGSTLFCGLYAVSIITNTKDISKKN